MYAVYNEELSEDYIIVFGGSEISTDIPISFINVNNFSVYDANTVFPTVQQTRARTATAFVNDALYWYSSDLPELSKMTFNGSFPNEVDINMITLANELFFGTDVPLTLASCMASYGNRLYFVQGGGSTSVYFVDLQESEISGEYNLSQNIAQLTISRDYAVTCMLNEFDNYLYVSDSQSNPIERIDLSNPVAQWELLDVNLTDLECPDGESYEWTEFSALSQAGLFVNANRMYLMSGLNLPSSSQIIYIDIEDNETSAACINTTLNRYQSAVK